MVNFSKGIILSQKALRNHPTLLNYKICRLGCVIVAAIYVLLFWGKKDIFKIIVLFKLYGCDTVQRNSCSMYYVNSCNFPLFLM